MKFGRYAFPFVGVAKLSTELLPSLRQITNNSGKWTWSCHVHEWFSEHMYLFWVCVAQVSHPDPTVMRESQASHRNCFEWKKKQTQLTTGNFLLCFMNECWAYKMVSALDSGSSRPGSRPTFVAGDIALCSWARHHFTLTVPLSTQVYKWVLGNLMLGVTLRWTSTPSRGEKYS